MGDRSHAFGLTQERAIRELRAGRILFHVTPARNQRSIRDWGILCSKSRGRIQAVWLVSRSRLRWAVEHVRARHSSPAVEVFACIPDREALCKRGRGVWFHAADVPPVDLLTSALTRALVPGGAS